jgi:membrane-bound lytic murein transglycosylase D
VAEQTASTQPTSAPTISASDDPPVQKPAVPETSQSPKADPVADLVASAEREYQAGLASYHAGKSEDARQHFDKAVNALLESRFDVRSDHRLEDKFNRIVTGVNDLYPVSADSAASNQEEQKSEPAPIDETNGIAPAADARTRAKAEAEIKSTHSDLPLMLNDQVAGYIAYFSGRGRGVFERAFARSGRYRDMMLPILKQEGVPQDLIYLAQAESGFQPLAVSRAGARGIWQFMAERGRGYGLYHTQWVDDRQDPEKSTRAAAHHLKDLYNQFGDWYLAMAAYNSGPGTVQAAVKRTGYADFWELYRRNVLPKETRNYVPIILAVTLMAKNPSQYGLDSVVTQQPSSHDSVTIDYAVDLRLVADCTGATLDELQDLNPSLLRLSTPAEGSFQLHLPAGTAERYETIIASIPSDMRLSWRYHTVGGGETLATVARNYHTTTKSIEDANHLEGGELQANAGLVIPVSPVRHGAGESGVYARRLTAYRIRKGDTVENVAGNFGIPPQLIRRWNGLRGSSLGGRRLLALHLPVSPAHNEVASRSARSQTSRTKAHGSLDAKANRPVDGSAGSEATETANAKSSKSLQTERMHSGETAVVHHKVKSGETLYSIAMSYKTTVAALERDNRNVAVLRPGMVLVVQTSR